MQVKKTTVNKNRTTSELDLFSEFPGLSEKTKEEVRKEVGEFLKEQVLLSVSESKSPISSGKFKATLSKKYAKEKKSLGMSPVANLELSGEMLDELQYRPTSKGIEFGVIGRAAPRADGHNNFSGESKLPARQFLPKEGDKFKDVIQKEAEQIIRDKIAENIEKKRLSFARVKNRDELFSVLREMFPDFSSTQIVDTILRQPSFVRMLGEFNLLRFLNGQG